MKVILTFKQIKQRYFRAAVLNSLRKLDADDYVLVPSWKEVAALGQFEPSAKILRGPDDFSDPDAERLVGAINIGADGYYSYHRFRTTGSTSRT